MYLPGYCHKDIEKIYKDMEKEVLKVVQNIEKDYYQC